jgi:acyl-coenzyme A synthetase/AMP-(fatty) acid ligase
VTAGFPRVATVVDGLNHHAAARSNAPVWLALGRTVTFGELHARVGGCAAWLAAQHVERGEIVGLSVADELDHFVVALGLASLGATHVVLSTMDAAPARSRLAERVGARRVVATLDDHRLPGLDTIALEAERAESWASAPPAMLSSPDPASLLTFFSTSGTTGESKLIPARHDDFMLQVARARVGRVLSPMSIELPIAKRQYLYAVVMGTSVVARPAAGTPIIPLCRELEVSQIASNAARAKELMGDVPRDGRLPPHTELTAAGGHTSAAFRRQLLENVCDAVYITYSMQECGSVARTVERVGETTDSVGRIHAGVEIAIVDADGQPLPGGEIGEIRIRAPGMTRGYLNDPAANAKHFRDGWFCPGDLASWTPDGALIIHGRADDVMILNGIKVAPIEIERALERHPDVKAVVAFPVRSPVHGEVPIAAVELAEGARVDERELTRFAREALGLRAPRRVMIVDALPSTANGKIDVHKLTDMMKRETTQPPTR